VLLAHFGIDVTDEQLAAFLEAEHAAWVPAQVMHATSHALLDSLRARELKLGIVSNAFDPGWLLHRDLEATGLAERVDFAVFSSEIGRRKPDATIFRHALEALDVVPERALFVGDRLYEDVRGASEVGMRTVQALWFRADEHPEGGEPDYQAFTQMDVLNVVRRLTA
jgi:putative hydrolase of the HAD superfamily